MMKRIVLAIMLLICLMILAACSAGGAPAPSADPAPMATGSAPAAPMEAAMSTPVTMEADSAGAEVFGGSGGYESASVPGVTETRKVVYSAEYRLETDDFSGTIQRLEQKIAVSGSYIERSDSRAATEYSPAYASLNIRVPAATYGDFNTFLNNLASLISSNKHGEDVTAQYFDTEARLKVLKAQEERILAFIANSKDLDEIFKIERELTRISTEIEQLTTVKNRLDNLTAYATVYVEIYETSPDEVLIVERDAFGARVEQALQGSLKALVTLAQGLVLLLIWVWPLLVIAAVAVLLWRKLGGKKKRAVAETGLPLPEEKENKD